MTTSLYDKYKRILSSKCLADLASKQPKKLIELVIDFRREMNLEFGLEEKDITYRSLTNASSAFDVGIRILVQQNTFSDMTSDQVNIYHFLYGDWLMSNINKLIDRGFVTFDVDYTSIATLADTETHINVKVLNDFDASMSDDEFMTSKYSEIEREDFSDTSGSGYFFVQQVPGWIHPGSDDEDKADGDPSYFLCQKYIKFVESRKDFPDRDTILNIAKRWAHLINTAPGIEALTDVNISDDLRSWVNAHAKCGNLMNRRRSVYNLEGVRGVSPGPLPNFNYEKTFTHAGESVTMFYRVFISRNTSLDLFAIKTVVSK